MVSNAYQSFAGTDGDSHSGEKLSKLGIPLDLCGRSLLDLCCNEGFFSIAAIKRGARRVVGVDHNPALIQRAQRRAADAQAEIEFVSTDVFDLPDEQFDYILFLSALHYIEEPAKLLETIRRKLTRDGVLILEIGVAAHLNERRSVRRAMRSIDERFFPTPDLLKHVWLRGYAVREHGPSVPQPGDPVPRYVFHCRPEKTTVLFILGQGGIGKSNLAANLATAPIVSTDQLFSPARYDKAKLIPEQKLYDETFSKTKSIWATWEQIKAQPSVRTYFTDVISRAIRHCAGDGVVIVEGFVATDLVEDVKAKLGTEYNVWRTDKLP